MVVMLDHGLVEGLQGFLEVIKVLSLDDVNQVTQKTNQIIVLITEQDEVLIRVAGFLPDKRLEYLVLHHHMQFEILHEYIEKLDRRLPVLHPRGKLAVL